MSRSAESTAPKTLAAFFERNGYRREPVSARLSEGSQVYKKGVEVRLVANSTRELKIIRRLLREVGLKPGRPWTKGNQIRQPVYGSVQVERFLKLIGADRA